MHFYEKLPDGAVEPRHFVPMVSRPKELRPTRISDVRKMWKAGQDVQPSVTTIMDVLGKPGLVNWKIDKHLEQAFKWSIHYKVDVTNEDAESKYIREIKRLTEIEMDKAPSAGTAFHGLMEKYVLGDVADMSMQDRELCGSVMEAIAEHTQNKDAWDYKPEVNFVSDHGFGGQIDLRTTSFHEWVIDFKTKQTADKFKPGKMAYDEHRMQLSAYREGVKLPKARCANVFVCLEDGQIDFHEHAEDELKRGWEMFKCCQTLWNLKNRV